MRCGGVVSIVGCHGPRSVASSLGTSRWCGSFTRTRTSVSRHDSRQEPQAVVPLVRICAGGGAPFPSLPRAPPRRIRPRPLLRVDLHRGSPAAPSGAAL